MLAAGKNASACFFEDFLERNTAIDCSSSGAEGTQYNDDMTLAAYKYLHRTLAWIQKPICGRTLEGHSARNAVLPHSSPRGLDVYGFL